MRHLFLCVSLGLLVLAGCASKQAPDAVGDRIGAVKQKGVRQDEAAQAPAVREQAGGQAAVKEKIEPRKLIYTGRVELIVDDFDKAEAGLRDVLKEQKGYISAAEVTGQPGEPRFGTWTLRIPAENYEEFLTAVKSLGELRKQTRDTEDVTDRYHDTRAEVTNLEAREQALRQLYKEKIAGSKLTDLLEVDRELNNVRTQINVRKGQLQRWDKLIEFATVILTMRDRKGYFPPTSPDFGTSVGRTFHGSLELLVNTGKALVLAAVALGPWLVVLAFLCVVGIIPVRVYRRKKPVPSPPPSHLERPASSASPPPPPPSEPTA
jgi:hypothetical protein